MLLLNPFTTSFYYGRNSTINSNYLQFLLLLRNQLIKNSDRNRNWLFGAAMNEPTQLVDLRLLRPLRPPSPLEWPSLLGYPGGGGSSDPGDLLDQFLGFVTSWCEPGSWFTKRKVGTATLFMTRLFCSGVIQAVQYKYFALGR